MEKIKKFERDNKPLDILITHGYFSDLENCLKPRLHLWVNVFLSNPISFLEGIHYNKSLII
jgi:hypothetical protein